MAVVSFPEPVTLKFGDVLNLSEEWWERLADAVALHPRETTIKQLLDDFSHWCRYHRQQETSDQFKKFLARYLMAARIPGPKKQFLKIFLARIRRSAQPVGKAANIR